MIFLTVGTLFPFDRLVKAVELEFEKGHIKDEIFAQVGKGGYRPKNFESVETLEKHKYDRYFSESDSIIAHAGMGTITMALEESKPILVSPRLKEFSEHVNNHQLSTARCFEELGHILAVYDLSNLEKQIIKLNTFTPEPRRSQADQVAAKIGDYLKNNL